MRRWRKLGLVSMLLACLGILLPTGTFALTGDSQDFSYTGDMQTYTVPAGVTKVKIEAWGASGGIDDRNQGGLGGYSGGELDVTPGEILYIFAGGQGADCTTGKGGGYNGGADAGDNGCSGGGGGASDVRVGGTDIADRVIVAGGGGGAGLYSDGGPGGTDFGEYAHFSLFQGQKNGYDGGGGGGGYFGGKAGFYQYDPGYVYGYADVGGYGGTSYTGGVIEGSAEAGVHSGNGQVKITIVEQDLEAPVTTASIHSDANAVNNWYHTPVTLTLSATDNASGVAYTEYQTNGGDWTKYDEPLTFDQDGKYNVTYRSVDKAGNTETNQSQQIWIDQTAPTLSVSLDKTELWAPNHKMETVKATVTANDSMSGVENIKLVSITSNEPGSGDIQNASFGTYDTSFDLRAERSGQNKSGRVYTITYNVTDVAGNVKTQTVIVTVPHNK